MMANFKVTIRAAIRAELDADTSDIHSKREDNIYCSYPVFVDRLMKGMATPAEEFHHATTGMSGEAGELLDQSKKIWIYNKPMDLDHVIEELGDIRFYYQAVLNMLQLTDETIQAMNTKKLMKRYPDGVYSDNAAKQRADKDQAAWDSLAPNRRFMGNPGVTAIPHGAGAGSGHAVDESLRNVIKTSVDASLAGAAKWRAADWADDSAPGPLPTGPLEPEEVFKPSEFMLASRCSNPLCINSYDSNTVLHDKDCPNKPMEAEQSAIRLAPPLPGDEA